MRNFAGFVTDYLLYLLKGGLRYYLWLGFLAVLLLPWGYGNYLQLTRGLIITGLTDQVSWGLYLANFVFLVGVAAGAVTVVFPAYVYRHKALHEVAVLGEMLAIAAVVMCGLFILNHMGRPDRLWHMIPYIGIFNWPGSMLTWDVIVLLGYLVLNLLAGFYYLYKLYLGEEVNRWIYLPLIYVAIVWAISIHTVTAFFINTMPARPFWNTGMMPIRFIVTAFAAGPALIVVVFLTVRQYTALRIRDEAIELLTQIIVWCLGIALFLTFSEIVTELYHPTEHANGLRYLMFGHGEMTALVPWFWGSLITMIACFLLLLFPSIRRNERYLPLICGAAFLAIWVEKGMGLLIPGSIPTPIGEYAEYSPTLLEIMNCVGNWAFGFIVLTLLVRGAVGVLLGEVRHAGKS